MAGPKWICTMGRVDYEEKFASVAKMVSVRFVLAITTRYGWSIH